MKIEAQEALLADLRLIASMPEYNSYALDTRLLCSEAANVIADLRRQLAEAREALRRIADDDVDIDLKGRADILAGIAWAALWGPHRSPNL